MTSPLKRVTVDDTYGDECHRINNSFISPGESEALEQRRCQIRCNVHSLYAKTLNKIWLRQHVVCHTKCCEDAENVLCSFRDGVPLK